MSLKARPGILIVIVISFVACAAPLPDHVVTRLSTAQCQSARPWVEGHTYSVGDLVTYSGNTYQCLQTHMSQPGWTPAAVPALWSEVSCGSGGGGGGGGGSGGTGGSGGGGGGGSCNPNAWVFMGSNANACVGHIGESCGWTSSNEGQGYHCQTTSWGTGCEAGGTTCPGGSGGGGSGGSGGGGGYLETFSTWYCGNACGLNDTGSCGTTYCGTQVSSSVQGAALSIIRMNGPSGVWMGGGLCGKQIEVVALDTGRSIIIPVIDACEACNQDDHVDLTLATWYALGLDPCAGTFRQKWRFVN